MTYPLLNDTPKSLYAPSGWTERLGIARIVLANAEHIPSFARFDSLGVDQAKILLTRLPRAALADRQNSAPRLGTLLRAVCRRPDMIRLSGYLIGPQRWDERVSVDMVSIRPTITREVIDGEEKTLAAGLPPLPLHPNHADLWAATRRLLGIDKDEADPPDELEYFAPLAGPIGGWWAWWD